MKKRKAVISPTKDQLDLEEAKRAKATKSECVVCLEEVYTSKMVIRTTSSDFTDPTLENIDDHGVELIPVCLNCARYIMDSMEAIFSAYKGGNPLKKMKSQLNQF